MPIQCRATTTAPKSGAPFCGFVTASGMADFFDVRWRAGEWERWEDDRWVSLKTRHEQLNGWIWTQEA